MGTSCRLRPLTPRPLGYGAPGRGPASAHPSGEEPPSPSPGDTVAMTTEGCGGRHKLVRAGRSQREGLTGPARRPSASDTCHGPGVPPRLPEQRTAARNRHRPKEGGYPTTTLQLLRLGTKQPKADTKRKAGTFTHATRRGRSTVRVGRESASWDAAGWGGTRRTRVWPR